MPRIAAATIAENRDQRRHALLAAAARRLAAGSPFTVDDLAGDVQLARASVYEYFSSATDAAAEAAVVELEAMTAELATVASADLEPRARVRAWVRGRIALADGPGTRIVRTAEGMGLSPDEQSRIDSARAAVAAALVRAVADTGHADAPRSALYIEAITEAAARAITSGSPAPAETGAALDAVDRLLDITREDQP